MKISYENTKHEFRDLYGQNIYDSTTSKVSKKYKETGSLADKEKSDRLQYIQNERKEF